MWYDTKATKIFKPYFDEAGIALPEKPVPFTSSFTGRLGRGISSRLANDLSGKEKQFLPFPLQSMFMSSLRKAALDQQQWDRILFWGGQIAPILKHTKASVLMRSLIEETSEIMGL